MATTEPKMLTTTITITFSEADVALYAESKGYKASSMVMTNEDAHLASLQTDTIIEPIWENVPNKDTHLIHAKKAVKAVVEADFINSATGTIKRGFSVAESASVDKFKVKVDSAVSVT